MVSHLPPTSGGQHRVAASFPLTVPGLQEQLCATAAAKSKSLLSKHQHAADSCSACIHGKCYSTKKTKQQLLRRLRDSSIDYCLRKKQPAANSRQLAARKPSS